MHTMQETPGPKHVLQACFE